MNINNLKFTEFYDFIAICSHIQLYVSAQNQVVKLSNGVNYIRPIFKFQFNKL